MLNLTRTAGVGLVAFSVLLSGSVMWDASVLHGVLGPGVDEATVTLGAMSLALALTTVGYVMQKVGSLPAVD